MYALPNFYRSSLNFLRHRAKPENLDKDCKVDNPYKVGQDSVLMLAVSFTLLVLDLFVSCVDSLMG